MGKSKSKSKAKKASESPSISPVKAKKGKSPAAPPSKPREPLSPVVTLPKPKDVQDLETEIHLPPQAKHSRFFPENPVDTTIEPPKNGKSVQSVDVSEVGNRVAATAINDALKSSGALKSSESSSGAHLYPQTGQSGFTSSRQKAELDQINKSYATLNTSEVAPSWPSLIAAVKEKGLIGGAKDFAIDCIGLYISWCIVWPVQYVYARGSSAVSSLVQTLLSIAYAVVTLQFIIHAASWAMMKVFSGLQLLVSTLSAVSERATGKTCITHQLHYTAAKLVELKGEVLQSEAGVESALGVLTGRLLVVIHALMCLLRTARDIVSVTISSTSVVVTSTMETYVPGAVKKTAADTPKPGRDFGAEKLARKAADMPDVDPEIDLAALRAKAQGAKMSNEEKKARGLLYDTSIASAVRDDEEEEEDNGGADFEGGDPMAFLADY